MGVRGLCSIMRLHILFFFQGICPNIRIKEVLFSPGPSIYPSVRLPVYVNKLTKKQHILTKVYIGIIRAN